MAEFEVRWQNFRSFRDTGWLEVRPLTVLIGPNNAGKTSLTAPLLALKQTNESVDPRTALLTTGPLANLGFFDDIAHRRRHKAEVLLGLRWHTHPRPATLRPRGSDPPGAATFGFRAGDTGKSVELCRYEILDVYLRPLLKRLRRNGQAFSLEELPVPPPQPKDATPIDSLILEALKHASPQHFLFTANPIWRTAVEASVEEDDEHVGPSFISAEFHESIRYYEAIVNTVNSDLDLFFRRLHYIGPLRERIRRVYELSGEMPIDTGTRGERAPEIIYRWDEQPEKLAELRRWLRRFGFSDTLTAEAVGDYAFSLRLINKRTDRSTALLDLGFGMSQVLPLIVQGLHGTPRSLLIAEQPEIHLNPRLQALLADLFASFVSRDQMMIVETHSEHLLLRLRRLIADGVLDNSDVALYYVEKRGDSTRAREVPIHENGHIRTADWPRDFFDEALAESIALAEAQMKRRDGK